MDVIYHVLASFKTMYEFSTIGTVVPKRFGLVKDDTIMYVVCACSWFSKRN